MTIKLNGLSFGKHGIRDEAKNYFKCSYSHCVLIGDTLPTITIYGHNTTGRLPAIMDTQNDTDSQTDYFESDRARIKYGTAEYFALLPLFSFAQPQSIAA